MKALSNKLLGVALLLYLIGMHVNIYLLNERVRLANKRIDVLSQRIQERAAEAKQWESYTCITDGSSIAGSYAYVSVRKPGHCSPYPDSAAIGVYAQDAKAGSIVWVEISPQPGR